MARSMLSLGMLAALARWTASRSLKFIVVSPPPCFAARMISRESFVKTAPRLASAAPFWRLIVDPLECPDISEPRLKGLVWTSECRTPGSYRVGQPHIGSRGRPWPRRYSEQFAPAIGASGEATLAARAAPVHPAEIETSW